MASPVRGSFADPITLKARPKETSHPYAKVLKVALGAIAMVASYVFLTPEAAMGVSAIVAIVTLLSLFNLKRPSSDDSYPDRDPVLSSGRIRYFPRFFSVFSRRGRVRTSEDLPARRESVREDSRAYKRGRTVVRSAGPVLSGTRAPVDAEKREASSRASEGLGRVGADSPPVFSGTRAPIAKKGLSTTRAASSGSESTPGSKLGTRAPVGGKKRGFFS